MPVNSEQTPALMAAFPVDGDAAASLLPGDELHPVRLPGGRGLLVVTVVNYEVTDIGRYVEYSLASRARSAPGPHRRCCPACCAVTTAPGSSWSTCR